MPEIPLPTIMELDPNDENIILGIPEDCEPKPQGPDSALTSTPKKVVTL